MFCYFQIHSLNPFPYKPWFLRVCSTSLLKTEGIGEIARNEQFLLFPQWFLPVLKAFCRFHQIWNCRMQTLSVWKRLTFVVWERVKNDWRLWTLVVVGQKGIFCSLLPCPMAQSVALRTWQPWGGRWFDPQLGQYSDDDSRCDRIHSSVTAVRCFDNGDVE